MTRVLMDDKWLHNKHIFQRTPFTAFIAARLDAYLNVPDDKGQNVKYQQL